MSSFELTPSPALTMNEVLPAPETSTSGVSTPMTMSTSSSISSVYKLGDLNYVHGTFPAPSKEVFKDKVVSKRSSSPAFTSVLKSNLETASKKLTKSYDNLGAIHSFDIVEAELCAAHINARLLPLTPGDPLFTIIPIPPMEHDKLFSACASPELLARLIALALPTAVFTYSGMRKHPKSPVHETLRKKVVTINNSLSITSSIHQREALAEILLVAQKAGIRVDNIAADNLLSGKPHLCLSFLKQLIKLDLLSGVNLPATYRPMTAEGKIDVRESLLVSWCDSVLRNDDQTSSTNPSIQSMRELSLLFKGGELPLRMLAKVFNKNAKSLLSKNDRHGALSNAIFEAHFKNGIDATQLASGIILGNRTASEIFATGLYNMCHTLDQSTERETLHAPSEVLATDKNPLDPSTSDAAPMSQKNKIEPTDQDEDIERLNKFEQAERFRFCQELAEARAHIQELTIHLTNEKTISADARLECEQQKQKFTLALSVTEKDRIQNAATLLSFKSGYNRLEQDLNEARTELRQNIELIQAERDVCSNLETKCQQLEKSLSEAQLNARDKAELVESETRRFIKLETAYDFLARDLSQAHLDAENTSVLLKDQKAIGVQLDKKCSQLEIDLTEAKAEVATGLERIEAERTISSSVQAGCERLAKELQLTRREHAESIDAKQNCFLELQTAHEHLTNVLSNTHADIEEKSNRLTAEKAHSLQLEQELLKVSTEMNEKSSIIHAQEKRIEDLSIAYAAVKTEADEKTATCLTLRLNCSQLEKDLIEVRLDIEKKLSIIAAERATSLQLQKHRDRLEDELSKIRDEVEENQDVIQHQNRISLDVQGKCERLEKLVSSLQNQIESCNTEKNRDSELAQEYEERLRNLSTDAERYLSDLNSEKASSFLLHRECRQFEEDLSKARIEVKVNERTIQAEKDKSSDLQKCLVRETTQFLELKSAYERLERDLSNAQTEAQERLECLEVEKSNASAERFENMNDAARKAGAEETVASWLCRECDRLELECEQLRQQQSQDQTRAVEVLESEKAVSAWLEQECESLEGSLIATQTEKTSLLATNLEIECARKSQEDSLNRTTQELHKAEKRLKEIEQEFESCLKRRAHRSTQIDGLVQEISVLRADNKTAVEKSELLEQQLRRLPEVQRQADEFEDICEELRSINSAKDRQIKFLKQNHSKELAKAKKTVKLSRRNLQKLYGRIREERNLYNARYNRVLHQMQTLKHNYEETLQEQVLTTQHSVQAKVVEFNAYLTKLGMEHSCTVESLQAQLEKESSAKCEIEKYAIRETQRRVHELALRSNIQENANEIRQRFAYFREQVREVVLSVLPETSGTFVHWPTMAVPDQTKALLCALNEISTRKNADASEMNDYIVRSQLWDAHRLRDQETTDELFQRLCKLNGDAKDLFRAMEPDCFTLLS